MYLEDDDTSNLPEPELTPISSSRCVQKLIQNSTITIAHSSAK